MPTEQVHARGVDEVTPPRKPIRVLVADDHPVVRSGLALMLAYEPDMEVAAQAARGVEAVDLFRVHRPDVTLMDLRMPDMDGVQAITAIRGEFPGARIILLTTYGGDEGIYNGLRAGAQGYLLKDAPCEEILEAVRVVYSGRKSIPLAVGARLAQRAGFGALTAREMDVLRLMAEGMTNREISAALHVSQGTVKFHVYHILSKLDATDRTQAVVTALKRGLATLG